MTVSCWSVSDNRCSFNFVFFFEHFCRWYEIRSIRSNRRHRFSSVPSSHYNHAVIKKNVETEETIDCRLDEIIYSRIEWPVMRTCHMMVEQQQRRRSMPMCNIYLYTTNIINKLFNHKFIFKCAELFFVCLLADQTNLQFITFFRTLDSRNV